MCWVDRQLVFLTNTNLNAVAFETWWPQTTGATNTWGLKKQTSTSTTISVRLPYARLSSSFKNQSNIKNMMKFVQQKLPLRWANFKQITFKSMFKVQFDGEKKTSRHVHVSYVSHLCILRLRCSIPCVAVWNNIFFTFGARRSSISGAATAVMARHEMGILRGTFSGGADADLETAAATKDLKKDGNTEEYIVCFYGWSTYPPLTYPPPPEIRPY